VQRQQGRALTAPVQVPDVQRTDLRPMLRRHGQGLTIRVQIPLLTLGEGVIIRDLSYSPEGEVARREVGAPASDY